MPLERSIFLKFHLELKFNLLTLWCWFVKFFVLLNVVFRTWTMLVFVWMFGCFQFLFRIWIMFSNWIWMFVLVFTLIFGPGFCLDVWILFSFCFWVSELKFVCCLSDTKMQLLQRLFITFRLTVSFFRRMIRKYRFREITFRNILAY